jgi:hypothetical protein
MHRRCVGSSGAERLLVKTYLHAASWPSDKPMLSLTQGVGSSGAEDFVLARLCLDSNWASDRPTVSSLRPSDHSVLLSSLFFLCNSSGASTKWTVGSSDGANIRFCLLRNGPSTQTLAFRVPSVHPTVSFLFLSFVVFDPWKYTIFSIWHVVFWHSWDLEMSTKIC